MKATKYIPVGNSEENAYKAGYKQALDDLLFQVYQCKDDIGMHAYKEVEKVSEKLEYFLKGE